MQAVFNRLEKKYIIGADRFAEFSETLLGHMHPDSYGLTTICSLYYDTPDSLLIGRSIEKPLYKEKLRLRSYGVPDDTSEVFIELKKKFKGVVHKRRIAMPCAEAVHYLATGEHSCGESQILSEIDWVRRFYPLQPAAFVAYDRTALVSDEDSGLRITLDRNIRCRDTELSLTAGDHGRLILPVDQCLMEIKTLGGMPLWLCSALSLFELYPASFSKYGTFFTARLAGNHGG